MTPGSTTCSIHVIDDVNPIITSVRCTWRFHPRFDIAVVQRNLIGTACPWIKPPALVNRSGQCRQSRPLRANRQPRIHPPKRMLPSRCIDQYRACFVVRNGCNRNSDLVYCICPRPKAEFQFLQTLYWNIDHLLNHNEVEIKGLACLGMTIHGKQ